MKGADPHAHVTKRKELNEKETKQKGKRKNTTQKDKKTAKKKKQ